jgi:hypothetical protein
MPYPTHVSPLFLMDEAVDIREKTPDVNKLALAEEVSLTKPPR